MAPRKKNPAIKSSGATSSKASPLPDWVKGGGPKPAPSYTKAAKAEQKQPQPQDDIVFQDPSLPPPPATSQPNKDGPSQQQRELLFPPGSKTPLNMLYERCQKLPGWEKPMVETVRHRNGFSCVVTLKKVNKKDALNPFTVSLEPKEPGVRLECKTSLEAKHWGATYALFRIFNNLSLHRALPPGPREYWLQLEAYKKEAPSHQDWMWEVDPFEAKAKREAEKAKKEKERQAAVKSAAKGEVQVVHGKLNVNGKPLSKAWQEAKEVRLSSALRETIEATIRRAMSIFPDACTAPLNLEEDQDTVQDAANAGSSERKAATIKPSVNVAALEKQLVSLGFRPGHARSAAKWLASARQALSDAGSFSAAAAATASGSGSGSLVDPLLASAASLGDREAAIEYLMLYTPEDDLPATFRPTPSSERFVTSSKAGSGGDGLAISWAIDRLTKFGGYPRQAVTNVFDIMSQSEARLSVQLSRQDREGLALEMLNRQMAGWDHDPSLAELSSEAALTFVLQGFNKLTDDEKAEIQSKRDDETIAVEAVLGSDRIVAVADHERTQQAEYDIRIAGPGTEVGGNEDVRLRIKSFPFSNYPSPYQTGDPILAMPLFFVASTTLPSYLRLALTQHLLHAMNDAENHFDWQSMLHAGDGGIVLAMVEELEAAWKAIVDEPPPLGTVTRYLVAPKTHLPSDSSSHPATPPSSASSAKRDTVDSHKRPPKPLKANPQVNVRLEQRQKLLHQSAGYAKIGAVRRSLPAHASTQELLSMIESNRVIIVAGETGCGKTTQVPQFILDDAISNGWGSECNIVVTQPKRVSAMGVAARVAVERGEDLDSKRGSNVPDESLVGYAIRGERKASKGCRLLFTTTGVLLRRLGAGGDQDLSGISHVIVDEVHERSVDSDFLLLELREVLKRNPKIKVILMSATINQETFSDYFQQAPCLEIPGRTYPVTDYYLEDVVQGSGFRFSDARGYSGGNSGNVGIDGKQAEQQRVALRSHLERQGLNEDSIKTVEAVSRSNRLNYELVGATARYVIDKAEEQESKGQVEKRGVVGGAILVFCPGVGEIRQAMDSIRSAVASKVDILPLHANLSPEEQRRVFQPAKPGHRKIVVSTNVAETSITIPDISYVIDTGRVKETRFEPESGLTRLVECWASRAACRQRRGRAGRVRAGECFKLYTRHTEQTKMTPQQTPEMKRVPLESLFLQIKSMRENEDVQHYLNKAIDPPSLASMDTALRTLMEVGALHSNRGYQSRLTSLGKYLAQLPLDLRLGKLLILGAVFGCLGPMLTVASIMSCKPLFSAPFEKREQASKARKSFALTAKSDLLADAAAFEKWSTMRSERRCSSEIREFCESNFLSSSTLRDIQTTRVDLLTHLQEFGLVPFHYHAFGVYDHPVLDIHASHTGILRSIIMAGLWPSVIRIALPSAKFDQSLSGTIQRESEARQLKYYDTNGRVFLHPSSTLFSSNKFESSYLATCSKSSTGVGSDAKVYLRDATEVPLFGLLLFGGRIKINHFAGGISIGSNVAEPGSKEEGLVKLRANARIGVLCAQLRRLLDAVLDHAIESPGEMLSQPGSKDVLDVIAQVLERDGLTA